jgi:hypothetical protein
MSPRAGNKKKKFDAFWLFYLVLIAAIAVALFTVHKKVEAIMLDYEQMVPENYIMDMIKGAAPGDGALGDFMEANVFSQPYGDGDARRARFYETVKSADIAFSAEQGTSTSSHPVFAVTADDKPFLRLTLGEGEQHTVLAILTVCDWTVEDCFLRAAEPEEDLKIAADNTVAYSFRVPEGFSVLIDGKPVAVPADAAESDLIQFQYVAPYTDVPVAKSFSVEGLKFEPVITAQNNAGEPINYVTEPDGTIAVPDSFVPTLEAQALAATVADPLAIAELWSKFMTNDVGGAYHGLKKVRTDCMLLPGSNLDTLAESWAKSVDITFVSHHSITGWTNGNVTNYVKFSDDFFSCDVYLEKNMHLTTGADRTDVFDNRMFFVNIKDESIAAPGWYLADMFSLAGSE